MFKRREYKITRESPPPLPRESTHRPVDLTMTTNNIFYILTHHCGRYCPEDHRNAPFPERLPIRFIEKKGVCHYFLQEEYLQVSYLPGFPCANYQHLAAQTSQYSYPYKKKSKKWADVWLVPDIRIIINHLLVGISQFVIEELQPIKEVLLLLPHVDFIG